MNADALAQQEAQARLLARPARFARCPLISRMKNTTIAPTRNVAALMYSARLTGCVRKKSRCRASTFVISDSTENSPAPSTGVRP